ncbi:hypothetical protein [Alloyangia pacifica]|uniref:hypothetical protein n=1 Tax=Alloyangia pacifica TaxID=311180 RepID=UPI001CD23D57|nr:hypothetical protein [Alloyangia pacifica]MCA0998660.1 hypothetical protein [Alloyangia pacifica]
MHLPPDSLFEQPQDGAEIHTGIRLGRGWHLESLSDHTDGDTGAAAAAPAWPLWSRSPRATLHVSAVHFPEPVPLRLSLQACAASPGHPVTLSISSPGHPPLTRQITGPTVLRIATPHHPAGAASSSITFELSDFASPLLLGRGTDPRQLGLGLTGLAPRWPLRARLRARLHALLAARRG